MNKIKINLKDWTYIGKYNHAAKWCRWLCSYYLIKEEKIFRRVQKINLFSYIIIFVPIHLLQALVCLWDGGLKEFIIFERNLGQDVINLGHASYERAEQIWDSRNKIKKDV